ncbi:phosphocholine cytidylyltransferase family protein [Cellulomonas edaphi]|uniref:NTP transferase domain-containing protein n=1 Tax=Cellulomonas edaphi TaxID=3053468 RepID=A0ABT7S817_9CELL|nr:NTP transferase domain-containing protein [Cellulomons edaphi]MDM7831763.1 NTP transferase domain-containing protein [Cellulomons edaphi]
MTTQVAILAAGMGTRLGRPFPKPLTPLRDGHTIMDQQVAKIRGAFADVQLYTVVGFKLEMILEAHPRSLFVYNEEFDRTNTSKSLLRVLRASGDGGLLWMNGDVVFDPAILERLKPYLEREQSLISVNTAAVAEEEVKYTVDADGNIDQLSKQVVDALGEAVGINYVAAQDKAALIARLDEVGDQDYFERGIEVAIQQDGLKFVPVDISDLWAVEVDFDEDLERANEHV